AEGAGLTRRATAPRNSLHSSGVPARSPRQAIVDVRCRSNDSLARLAHMETYLLIAIIAVALIYFLFFRGRVGAKRAARDAEVGRVGAGRGEARRAEPAQRKATPQPATVGAEEEEVVPESMDLAEARRPPTHPPSQPPPQRPSKRPSAPEVVSRAPDVQTLRRGLGRSRD